MVTEGENEHAGGREVCCVHRALSVCLSLSLSLSVYLSAVELGSEWVVALGSLIHLSESNLLNRFLRDLFSNFKRLRLKLSC